MSVQRRNNVRTAGHGPATMVFAHGFGCDQTLWRHLAPAFEDRFATALLDTLEANDLGGSGTMAPSIMGAPGRPELGTELADSFCRNAPEIARHFARVSFLSDHRAQLPRLQVPTLVLQCSDDMIVPRAVGECLQRTLPRSTLAVIDNVGHRPHPSSPEACARAMDDFLSPLMAA
jgi:sigma-B regulation protein RsbQ